MPHLRADAAALRRPRARVASANLPAVRWFSAMPVVATAEGGLVTARSAGQADVVAETDGVAGMVTVYVGSHSPGGDFREVGVGLIEQDRELAAIMTGGPEGRSSFWGPQLHEGLLYPSDIPHGVRVFEFTRR